MNKTAVAAIQLISRRRWLVDGADSEARPRRITIHIRSKWTAMKMMALIQRVHANWRS